MPQTYVPKRSIIWIYFKQFSRDQGKCYLCGALISTRGGSTSNLRRHLKSKHQKLAKEMGLHQMCKPYRVKEETTSVDNIKQEIIVSNKNERFHSEVVFHDYTNVEDIDYQINEASNKQKIIVEDIRPPMKKPNILQRRPPATTTNSSTSITKENNQIVLYNKNNGNVDALEDIASNLGRIATVFEKMSKIICSLNQQNNKDDHHDDVVETASAETDRKVHDLIMSEESGDDRNF